MKEDSYLMRREEEGWPMYKFIVEGPLEDRRILQVEVINSSTYNEVYNRSTEQGYLQEAEMVGEGSVGSPMKVERLRVRDRIVRDAFRKDMTLDDVFSQHKLVPGSGVRL